MKKTNTVKILSILKERFENNKKRHLNIEWRDVEKRLATNNEKLEILEKMELTGGEPDVIEFDGQTKEFIFCDCAPESPIGRRSLCYDPEALDSRKSNKPSGSVIETAKQIGIEILTEEQYRKLQKNGKYDLKTSSWINTPNEIRKLGGALFCDRRYNNVFVYHNGAESYYSARGFRGIVKV